MPIKVTSARSDPEELMKPNIHSLRSLKACGCGSSSDLTKTEWLSRCLR